MTTVLLVNEPAQRAPVICSSTLFLPRMTSIIFLFLILLVFHCDNTPSYFSSFFTRICTCLATSQNVYIRV